MDSLGHKVNEIVGASYCHGQGGNQIFEYSKKHQLAQFDNCLNAADDFGPVKLQTCDSKQTSQLWDIENKVIFNDQKSFLLFKL
jgi:polypeptide N-acetylgalactosaminyltransferase